MRKVLVILMVDCSMLLGLLCRFRIRFLRWFLLFLCSWFSVLIIFLLVLIWNWVMCR